MKTLDTDQQRRVDDAPRLYRAIVRRAYDGSASRTNAIKAFCLQCVGYVRKDVAHCPATACPLWAFRPTYETDADDPEIGPPEASGAPGAMAG